MILKNPTSVKYASGIFLWNTPCCSLCISSFLFISIYSWINIIKHLLICNLYVTFVVMSNRFREVVEYENHFSDFLRKQSQKVQDKIFKIIEAIETLERIPSNYLKHISGTNGLYETRIKLGSDIWRVFCFFDDGKLVVLLNGFTKKDQKTPKKEIEKALKLMNKYCNNKK